MAHWHRPAGARAINVNRIWFDVAVPVNVVELLQFTPLINICLMLAVPVKSAVVANATVPAAPPAALHGPLADASLWVKVIVTVSDTVAPPLRNVHVPVHVPARFSGVEGVVEGVVVEPPHADSARPPVTASARMILIG